MPGKQFKMFMSEPWVRAFWDARRMGMASRGVASAIDSNYGTVQRYLRQTGGIAPPQWKDPDRLLTLEERFRIKELLVEGHSLRHIGRVLGRSASTISREVKRGSDSATRSHYRPSQGHRLSLRSCT